MNESCEPEFLKKRFVNYSRADLMNELIGRKFIEHAGIILIKDNETRATAAAAASASAKFSIIELTYAALSSIKHNDAIGDYYARVCMGCIPALYTYIQIAFDVGARARVSLQ